MTAEILIENFETLADAPNGIPKLRELILQLAVQGKLVPQDPKDEPASVLLEKIRKEKERLIAEKKIRKSDPLPEIDPEEYLYELPTSWKWARLDDIADYNGRINADPEEIAPETWVLDLEDIEKDTSIIINRAIYAQRQSKSTKSTFCKGDVLYGKLRPYLNKVVVADKDGVCTTEIVPIVPFSGIYPHFLKILLKAPAFIAYVNALSYGVKMPRLGTEDAKKSIHGIPPSKEQQRIVAKVDQPMALCDELERKQSEKNTLRLALNDSALTHLIEAEPKQFALHWNRIKDNFDMLYDTPETVGKLRQAILQLAVQGKLVPQDSKDEPASVLLEKIRKEKERLIAEKKIKKGDSLPAIKAEEYPYELPRGWEWCRLGEIQQFTNGYTFQSSEYQSTGIGIVRIGDIQNGSIDKSTMKFVSTRFMKELDSKFRIEPGDMLIAMSGATTGKVGFNNTDETFLLNQRVGKIEPYFVDSMFVYFNLVTRIEENLSISSGSAIPNLSTEQINSIVLGLPSLAEQQRIVAKVDQLMALCEEMEKQLAAAEEVNGALLESVVWKVGRQS